MNIGDIHEIYGKLAAKMILHGERYYMLINDEGDVALLPADGFEDEPDDIIGEK